MAVAFGTTAVGSGDAIAGRLLSARQRASALLRQAMIDCERDACYGRGMPSRRDIAWEVEQIQAAIAVLCQARPERMTLDEAQHAKDAREFFEGEPEPERLMMREHLGLCR